MTLNLLTSLIKCYIMTYLTLNTLGFLNNNKLFLVVLVSKRLSELSCSYERPSYNFLTYLSTPQCDHEAPNTVKMLTKCCIIV